MIPGLVAAMGRFPGRWIGNADLPAGIARNWARWGRSPYYICDARGRPLRPHNGAVTFPIRWLSFTDDPAAPPAAVEALLSYYPNALIERRHLSPADLGVSAIGHFGFFRKSMPRPAWDEIADWLGDQMRQTGRQQELEELPACPNRTFSPRSRTASAG